MENFINLIETVYKFYSKKQWDKIANKFYYLTDIDVNDFLKQNIIDGSFYFDIWLFEEFLESPDGFSKPRTMDIDEFLVKMFGEEVPSMLLNELNGDILFTDWRPKL